MSRPGRDQQGSHKQQLVNEQSADERYQGLLRTKQELPRTYQGPRNTMWTGSGIPHDVSLPDGGLIGRVALDAPVPSVGGASFYIGPRHIQGNGLTVFSWAAPVAATLFHGVTPHKLNDHVVVARSLIRDRRSIIDFVDEPRVANAPEDPFISSPLQVPAAPAPRPLPPRPPAPRPSGTPSAGTAEPVPGAAPAGRGPSPTPTADTRGGRGPRPTQTPSADHPAPGGQPTPAPPDDKAKAAAVRPPKGTPSATPRPELRAAEALLAAVSAPREERLRNVLSTLQPDQYDLVTRIPRTPLVIQGHPGTGKTIVAAHRAAYLTHPDAPDGVRERRVLLIGPTQQYVNHVGGVLGELVQDRRQIEVTSIPELLWRVRGTPSRPLGSIPVRYVDVDPKLESLIRDALLVWTRAGLAQPTLPRERRIEGLYEFLRTEFPKRVADPEWAEYLRSLPAFRKAAVMGRFHALFAQCAWVLAPDSRIRADHIIVDEAQDVAPLEWRLLDRLNAGQRWTLLGDMNQRRSDWTQHGWQQLDGLLGLADEAGELTVTTMSRGYRTTAAIMAFAGALLPASERAVDSLQQGGEKPAVHRVAKDRLPAQVAVVATELKRKHGQGTVAVIAMAPLPYEQALRRAGWGPQHSGLQVLAPDAARGLEFDAVVVVEPAAFPKNLGRNGLLYTSLTRANRELAVVHSQPLPDALRKHDRR